MKKKTEEEYIKEVSIKHDFKYSYDNLIYNGAREYLFVTCKIHGDFKIRADHHLNGVGCSKCSGSKKKTKEDFIKDANKVHNNKWNYSKVNYINNRTNIEIICNIHGSFYQTPDNHISKKHGCPKCYGNKKRTNDEFIDKASKIHNNKWNYTKTKYINNNTPIIITCKEHGDFLQYPSNHLNGYIGCDKCKKKNKEDFIKESNLVHNYEYDYSKIEYVDTLTPIVIICKKHGEFIQRPTNHLHNRQGCPICKSSKGEKSVRQFLIKNNINYIQQKVFKECKNKSHLPFDFYLPNLNICIEYNGIQHYKSVEYFGGIDYFEKIKKHDKIKEDFCRQNGIFLLKIKYNEDIEKKLKLFLRIN